jgi:hypothetical protein
MSQGIISKSAPSVLSIHVSKQNIKSVGTQALCTFLRFYESTDEQQHQAFHAARANFASKMLQ